MFTADIETYTNADDQDHVEQPLVAHSTAKRTRTRTRQRLRQRNNFNGKRKIAQCMLTTLVILLCLGTVIALVYAIQTSEFNNEKQNQRNAINYRNVKRMTTKLSNLKQTRNVLVAAQDLSKWQPHDDASISSGVLKLPCQLQKCNIDFETAQLYYQAIVFYAKDIQESIIPLLLDDNALLIYANQFMPATDMETYSLRQQLHFNLTMSYRTDADIIWNTFEVLWPNGSHFAPALKPRWQDYQNGIPLTKQDEHDLLKIIEDRKQFAVFHLCNNSTVGAQIFEELKIYLPIGLIIEVDTKCDNIDLYEDIKKVNYKFMLTFEDVLCTDIISTYFYKALSRKVIPVVIGGPTSYDNFAPPHSYIRAEDFNSLRELVERLVYLDAHPNEYLKYIQLSNHLKIAPAPKPICQLCKFLHEQPLLELKNKYKINENWWTNTQCNNKFSLLSS